MPVMNNHGTSSGAIARRDKEFKGILGTYKEAFKKKDKESLISNIKGRQCRPFVFSELF